MKKLAIIALLFTLAGCETFSEVYSFVFGEDEQCIQLDDGSFVIYSPDGEVINCVE